MVCDIPQRASNDSDFKTLSKIDKQIIVYKVLTGASNQDAFRLFHPEYLDNTGKLNAAGLQDCKFFFNYGKNREYIEAYEKTVEEFFNARNKKTPKHSREVTDEEKVAALNSIVRYVVDNSIDIEKLEDPTILLKTADKVKLFDQIGEQEIKPIRVLMARCKSECRYRLFCESMVLEGQAIDECQYCKALKVAKDNGYKYDPRTNLDIPEDVVKRLEEKNNVSTLDILNGKVEN